MMLDMPNDTMSEVDRVAKERDDARTEAQRAQAELEVVRKQLAAARPPSDEIAWYSCAVCSCKSNHTPVRAKVHDCCGGSASVASCCRKAVANAPEEVDRVLDVSGHKATCKR